MAIELKTAIAAPPRLCTLVLFAICAAALIGLEALVCPAILAAQPWKIPAARYSLMQGDNEDGYGWSWRA